VAVQILPANLLPVHRLPDVVDVPDLGVSVRRDGVVGALSEGAVAEPPPVLDSSRAQVCADSPGGSLVFVNGGRLRFAPVPCKRRDCPRCGPRLRRAFERGLASVISGFDRIRFVTITLDPKVLPEDAQDAWGSIAYLREKWALVRFRMRRMERLRRMNWVAVVELQGNGRAHLHVVCDRYVPQRWLSGVCRDVGLGFAQVKEWKTGPKSAARYLTKYLSKQMHSLPRGTRGWSSCQGIAVVRRTKSWRSGIRCVWVPRSVRELSAVADQSIEGLLVRELVWGELNGVRGSPGGAVAEAELPRDLLEAHEDFLSVQGLWGFVREGRYHGGF